MFIENPYKKETYSFRIKPDLLRDIKAYGKATNQKVPEILAELIKEKVTGLCLTNDYLKEEIIDSLIISVPSLEEIYNNGNYKEFNLIHEYETGIKYEIKKGLPNNLDIWNDNKGYTTNKAGITHEGLSILLVPALVSKPEYLENLYLIKCCIVPVWFGFNNNSLAVKNISFDNAMEMLDKSGNDDLKVEILQTLRPVYKTINKYYNNYIKAIVRDKTELLPDLYNNLRIALDNESKKVNVNFISYTKDSIELTHDLDELLNTTLTSSDPNLLCEEIDILKDKLRESIKENQELRNTIKENEELKEKIINMEDEVNKIKKIFSEVENETYSREEILQHHNKNYKK